MYSTQRKDTIPSVSMLRKATLSFPQNTTKVKFPIHKLSPQAFRSFLVQQVNKPHDGKGVPMSLCSGKHPLPICHLDFPVRMAHKCMCCRIHSKQQFAAGSLDVLKASPSMFPQKISLIWHDKSFFSNLGISNTNQFIKPGHFMQASPTRDRKCIGCIVYSTK